MKLPFSGKIKQQKILFFVFDRKAFCWTFTASIKFSQTEILYFRPFVSVNQNEDVKCLFQPWQLSVNPSWGNMKRKAILRSKISVKTKSFYEKNGFEKQEKLLRISNGFHKEVNKSVWVCFVKDDKREFLTRRAFEKH